MSKLVLVSIVFVGSFFFIAIVRWFAGRYGLMVMPSQERWHKIPTALHGGVGLYLAFLAGTLLALGIPVHLYGLTWSSNEGSHDAMGLVIALLLGSLLMFSLGFVDDVKPLRPVTKVLYQLLAASLFLSAGDPFPVSGIHGLDIALTCLWFVGIMNAVNLLDNMDGLCSAVVIIAGMTIVLLALNGNASESATLPAVFIGLVLVAAVSGFWLHNRHPASIFMGDSGSLFIGFVLAALAVPSTLNGFMGFGGSEHALARALMILIPPTVLAVPIFDTLLVAITRVWNGQRISQGGRDHSSHRLVWLGFPEKKAVRLLYGLGTVAGVTAILMQHLPYQAVYLFVFFSLLLVRIGVYLARIKVQQSGQDNRSTTWLRLLSTLLYRHHAADVLLDTVLIGMCIYSADLLHFGRELPFGVHHTVLNVLPLVVLGCLTSNIFFSIYRNERDGLAIADVPRFAGAGLSGSILSFALITLTSPLKTGHTASVLIIFGVFFFLSMIGVRAGFRLLDRLFDSMVRDTAASGQMANGKL